MLDSGELLSPVWGARVSGAVFICDCHGDVRLGLTSTRFCTSSWIDRLEYARWRGDGDTVSALFLGTQTVNQTLGVNSYSSLQKLGSN